MHPTSSLHSTKSPSESSVDDAHIAFWADWETPPNSLGKEASTSDAVRHLAALRNIDTLGVNCDVQSFASHFLCEA